MRRDFEPEEVDLLSVTDTDPWAEGFAEGRMEVLGRLIPDLIERIDAILAEDTDLPDTVLSMLEMLDRWIEHYHTIESGD